MARQRAPLADGVNLLVRARLDVHLHQQRAVRAYGGVLHRAKAGLGFKFRVKGLGGGIAQR